MVGGDHSHVRLGWRGAPANGVGWGGGSAWSGRWDGDGGGVGPGLAHEAAVEDPTHVGLVAGPDYEQGDEERRDGPERDPDAGVVEGEPFSTLIGVCSHVPDGSGSVRVLTGGAVGAVGSLVGSGGGLVGGGDNLWVGLRRMSTVL